MSAGSIGSPQILQTSGVGNSEKLSKGCHNILINCANLSESQTLLIIREKEEFGWYKKDISETIYSEAKSMGLRPEILEVGEPENDAKNKLAEIINEYDCTIFFARVGDQDRCIKELFKWDSIDIKIEMLS